MKNKKIISILLALTIPITCINTGYAENKKTYGHTKLRITANDTALSDSAIDNNIDDLVAYSSEVSYPAVGGNIYYQPLTGIITAADNTVQEVTIPSTIDGTKIVAIGNYAFKDCNRLTKVYLPDDIKSLGEGCFYSCWNLSDINIPETVINIGKYVFYNCKSLKYISLPDTIENIGDMAFSMSGIVEINIPKSLSSISGSLFALDINLERIVIPENIESIADGAFSSCSALQEVIISDGVLSIGSSFWECRNLQSVVIPKTVKSIGVNAFNNSNMVTIYCYKNSFAETYAKEHNIPYEYIDSLFKIEMPSVKFYSVGTATDMSNCIEAILTPHTSDKTIQWTSSDENVVEIINTGNIDGVFSDNLFCNISCKSVGTSTITATLNNGASASCFVTVTESQQEPEKELGEYELKVLEQMIRLYQSPYLRYLLISDNFNHVLYMTENDTTMHGYVDAVGKGIFGGTDGIRDLLSSSTSIDNAESILIGYLEECDTEVSALAEAKAKNKVCSILNKSLEKYILNSTLNSDDINSIKSILGDDNFYNVFDKQGYTGLTKYVQNTLGASADSDIMKTLDDFSKSDQLQNDLSNGLDVLDIGLKVIDLSKTSIDNYTEYFALQEADEIYLEILEYIENNAIFDVVKDAAHNVRVRASQNIDEATYEIYLELINEGTIVIAEELWDEMLDKIWFLKAVKDGKDLGVNLSDIFFHTNESLDLKDSMRNLTYIGVAISSYIRNNVDAYLDDVQNNSSANATYYSERVIYASEMLYKIRSLGEECFENFCKANYISKWNDAIKSRKSCLEISGEKLFGENGKITIFKTLLISCPVNIEIYNSTNEKILTVYDGAETNGSIDNITYEVIYNEASDDYMKIINIPEDSDYYIKIIGNDLGSVNCLVSSINNDTGFVEYKGLYNIPVQDGSILTSTSINDTDNLKLVSEDDNIPTEEMIFSNAFNTDYVEMTGVSFEAVDTEMNVGEKQLFKFSYAPVNATNPVVMWSSSDSNIIKVNSDGVLEAVAEGEATITVTSFDEKYSDSIVVKVKKSAENISETTTLAVSETSTETTTITTQTTTETTTTTLTETTTETTTTYTVSFDSNGGSDVENIIVVAGNKIDELPVPVKEGYVFKGWYKDEYTFEVPFTSDDIVDSNLRLYAKWNRLITLTFDSNGGSAVESIHVEEGATTVLPKNTTKKGCTFGGWYLDELWSEEYTDTTEAPSYDRTLHAKWTKTLPSESEIRARYNSLDMSSVSNKYTQTPKTTAPYSTGKLSEQFVNQGLNYLNFIRYIEGLQDVEIDNSKVDTAQHGAVLLAALGGGLSHNPSKPSDMNEDFYNLGYETASSSNLSAGTSSLVGSLQGQLDDEDSSNIAVVGHRRWLTHPYMKYTAFGFAENNNSRYKSYSSVWAFDNSNEDVDFYDFIAYPAKGNFPSDLIDNTIPWSVSLNTALYKVDSANDINVKITKKSTGKTWNISQADHKSNPSTGSKYFNYDDLGYGIDSCIIFSIGQANISDSELNGEFNVEITGLKDKNGNDASINYTVNLFDLSTSGSSSSSGGSTSGGGSSGGGSSSGGSSGGGGGGGGGGSSTTYYTISFDSAGGNAVDSKKVILNSKLTRPSEPVRKGYEFTGWYTDKACTKPYDFKNKVTKSFTLYAGWKAVDNTEIEKENEEKETQKIKNINAISNAVRVTIGSNLVTVGNKTYAMDVTPYIQPESSSTLVPLRFAAIAISGGDVENADNSSIVGWDAETKTASITAGGKAIKFTAGSELMYIGNVPTVMENGVKAEIKDGRMFIPFRALGTALGVNVDWDAETKTAIYSVK